MRPSPRLRRREEGLSRRRAVDVDEGLRQPVSRLSAGFETVKRSVPAEDEVGIVHGLAAIVAFDA